MPAVHPNQIRDMLIATDKHRVRGKFVDLSLKYPEYMFMDILQDKSRHEVVDSFDYTHVVQIQNNSNARLSGCYDYDRTSQRPLNKEFTASVAQLRTNYEFDIHEKVFNSNSKTRIINYIEQKRHSMESDLVELIERLGWEAPSSPSQDPKPVLGIQHWLQRGTADEFNPYGGVDPSGWESVGRGGILTSEVERWANGTFRFQQIDSADCIRKWRRAIKKCKFKTPNRAKYPALIGKEGGSDYVFYTTTENEDNLEDILESKNENFGMDFGKYMGNVLMRGNPVQSVDYLDDTQTDNPIFGVYWPSWKILTPEGLFEDKSELLTPSDRSTVRVQNFYTWFQLVCLDLRRNFVGHQGAPS